MEIYSVQNDFGNVTPNIDQLYNEILNNPNITQNVNRYGSFDDNIIFEFNSTLSQNEKNILDNIVSSHIPQFEIETNNFIQLIPKRNIVNSNTYTQICTSFVPNIYYAKIKIMAYMENINNSYEIKITDLNNRTILLEKLFTNITESIQEMELNNINSTYIEFSLRKNGGNLNSKVFINNITISYI